ncbi:MAG: pyridoxal 5'-phosphate synthase glutaminase subunit PdxT [Chloroflexi bacterium]|nr:pyridoxal 5'-phosphate synthase glutaminase subunit PdxT [Chloroflexota bacterium]MBT7081458.1 pyridoxal 5'-phosphate synthase glutaminase subunit PdxT [Chloroflexota bacterium]MBT7290300.1 pyridoxal 5'-phosphate synthase glutaminase subunit PdxT [Chloroflexota bacterium]
MTKKIGVLALQGAFAEHISILKKLGVETSEVRLPDELDGIDGLIIPGGESTTITKLMASYELADKIKSLGQSGLPIMGTCAGMILLANKVDTNGKLPTGLMDIEVKRNAFGRQVDSFEIDLDIPAIGKKPYHAIFIRAPRIESAGSNVEVLVKLPDGTIVAARDGNILTLAFHPELTRDSRLHKYFLDIVNRR